jgi:hypothetical protein
VFVNLDEKASLWRFYMINIFYGIIATYVFWIGYFFNGIIYDSSTNWIPTYSWFFLIFSWTFILIFLVIPQIYYIFKLLKVFEGRLLRRRIKMFIACVVLELSVVFFLFLYNTLVDNQIFRTIFILIAPVASTLAAFLIYKSFGQDL